MLCTRRWLLPLGTATRPGWARIRPVRNGAALALLAVSLLTGATPFTPTSNAVAAVSSPMDIATADNSFGFRLLNAVQKTLPNGNVVLSPVSAALNLSMVLNGAEGQTEEEMLKALSLSGSDIDAINAANAQLIKALGAQTNGVTLAVADSLWVDSRRAMLRPDYEKRMQASYGAEMEGLDFSSPDTPRRINSWASKETRGKIPKVLDKIDPTEVLLLLNAVYFKGQWTHKFDKARTQQRDFTLANGTTRQVARMAQSGRFEYFETPQMQAIRLPFGDGDLVMEVLLPAQGSNLAALEAELTAEHWREWRTRYSKREGTIELPRFELESKYKLKGPLESLGMRRAFDASDAQLTRMLLPAQGQHEIGRLSVSAVLQSTYWKVDEEGSEAAAVTSTQIRATAVQRAAEPFHMVVDRPFFGAIEDRRSGVLLFVGGISDPGG
jgi:serine protease inhibitor